MGLSQLWLWLKRLAIFLQVATEVAVGKVLMTLFPGRVKQSILALGQKTGMARNPRFSPDNWVPTFFSIQYFRFILKVRWQRLEDRAESGGLAPNCTVVRLSGQKCQLWDFIRGELGGLEQWDRVGRIDGLESMKHPIIAPTVLWGVLSSCSAMESYQVYPLGWPCFRGSYHKPSTLAFQPLDVGSSLSSDKILFLLHSDIQSHFLQEASPASPGYSFDMPTSILNLVLLTLKVFGYVGFTCHPH